MKFFDIKMAHMKIEKMDFNKMLALTKPCADVPTRTVFPHKPLAYRSRINTKG